MPIVFFYLDTPNKEQIEDEAAKEAEGVAKSKEAKCIFALYSINRKYASTNLNVMTIVARECSTPSALVAPSAATERHSPSLVSAKALQANTIMM